jgi:predicted metal-binding membrane protein
MLWRYRMTLGEPGDTRIAGLTMRVGAGYFAVWIGSAMAIFPLGAALASLATQLPMLARAVPLATGVVVLAAGALQFTAWKARHLACCRKAPERVDGLSVDSVKAWRDGVRLGLHCSGCCAGFTAALLAVGVMDLRAMACVSAAITLERLGPDGARVARLIGVAVVATGSFLIVRAALPG